MTSPFEAALKDIGLHFPDAPIRQVLSYIEDGWNSLPPKPRYPMATALWIRENMPSVVQNIHDKQMILAIKEVRVKTRCGLMDAKNACELLRDLLSANTNTAKVSPFNGLGADHSPFELAKWLHKNSEETASYLKQGKKIHAIKAARIITNSDLKPAKEACEILAWMLGLAIFPAHLETLIPDNYVPPFQSDVSL